MSLVNDIPMMLAAIENHSSTAAHNHELLQIFEGDLLTYIEKDLKNQLNAKSYERIKHRIAPINILKRMIDKQSKIYQQNPSRRVVDGTTRDQELVDWYKGQFELDQKMNLANEFFNLFKSTLIMPYLYNRKPGLRAVPSDQFIVLSMNPVNPMEPTHIIVSHGSHADEKGKRVAIFAAYTDAEFIMFNSDGHVMTDLMVLFGNPEGINPYGALPGVYVNRSMTSLIPVIDSDTLKMTKIIPILLSDLNYAVMFQAFSIIYAINVDDKNLEMSPSAFWSFKQDLTTQQKPEVGVIKPQVEIDAVINLIKAELVFWLETRGLKAGSVGTLDSANFASGVSKMIDEMDTSEDRKKQIEYFRQAETKLWDLVLNKMHPLWVATGAIDTNQIFTPSASVSTDFAEPLPMVSRGQIVKDLKEEHAAGFISRKRALRKLNPEMSESEIDQLIAEIDEERAANGSPELPTEDDDAGKMAANENTGAA